MNRSVIRSSAREIIYKVYKRCLAESEAGQYLSDLNDVYKRTAEMTGKSVSTIRRIALEGQRNKGVFSTPGKHRAGRPRKDLDDFDLCAIRQKIQFFYTVKKIAPTLRNLLPVVREDLQFSGSREHLRKVLIKLGFKYRKCQSDRQALMEKPNIAAKREVYLEKIIENRNLPDDLRKDIIYLDESYVHTSYKLKKCWQSIDIHGIKENVSKGKRYIIIHAGSENGFVPNALLIFSGKNKNEDYHSEMNKNNFTKWVTEKLIPNVPKPSIIVMDNAPYHSVVRNKAPTSASKVSEIKLWLSENNIPFSDTTRKPNLLMLVKQHKPEPIYEIDDLLNRHGHTVVRLPPYHCDLNPIELVWGIAKQKIASHNVGSVDIKAVAEQAFQSISTNDWRNSCQHVMKIEREYYERGRTLYDDIERIIINLQDESSSTESSEDSQQTVDEDSPQNSDEDCSGVEYLDESIFDSD
ncbi:uncharacterized protein LOC113501772 isoform X2 [Trichoplusia ni]|uniref:Uncharacterized protein LOC113501772 isoform X2 n=2 Tax=Trichoplusia ni TaxID=7111 RepID=A0A7E5WDQ8_TRINI|nr:uncharacterized protein LOC113501772 isoform X2 [Trichoplusia ni]